MSASIIGGSCTPRGGHRLFSGERKEGSAQALQAAGEDGPELRRVESGLRTRDQRGHKFALVEHQSHAAFCAGLLTPTES